MSGRVYERCKQLAKENPDLTAEEVYQILRDEGYNVSFSSVRNVYWPRARKNAGGPTKGFTVRVDSETYKGLVKLMKKMGCSNVSEAIKRLVEKATGNDNHPCLFRSDGVCTLVNDICNPDSCPLDKLKSLKKRTHFSFNVKQKPGEENMFKKNKTPTAEQITREFQTLLSYCKDVETLKEVRDRTINTLLTIVQMMTEGEKAKLIGMLWPHKPEPTLAETVTAYVRCGEQLKSVSQVLAPFIAEVAKGSP